MAPPPPKAEPFFIAGYKLVNSVGRASFELKNLLLQPTPSFLLKILKKKILLKAINCLSSKAALENTEYERMLL